MSDLDRQASGTSFSGTTSLDMDQMQLDGVADTMDAGVLISRNHRLKCLSHWFDEIACGRKTFDVRTSKDRVFQAGDTLELFRWDPRGPGHHIEPRHQTPGSGLFVNVVAVYHNLPGVNSDYCVMAIALPK